MADTVKLPIAPNTDENVQRALRQIELLLNQLFAQLVALERRVRALEP